MEGQTQQYQLTEGTQAIEAMKYYTSYVMTQWQQALRTIEYPEEIDYDSKEEYELAKKKFIIEIIDDIKEIKQDIFSGVLDSYNQFLAAKHQFDTVTSKETEKYQQKMIKANQDLIARGLVCFTISLMFPGSAPLIILVNAPRTLYDIHSIKKGKIVLAQNAFTEQKIKEIQNPFFDFTCTLRTDYHESKKKLEELKKRVMLGESIEQELLEMFNPKKLSLPNIEEKEENNAKILKK